MFNSAKTSAVPGPITRSALLERRRADEKRVQLATNLGLATAVLIGVVVCLFHGGVQTASLATFGASLGLGGVLGFLFGVPTAPKQQNNINIRQPGPVAIDTGAGSLAKSSTGTPPQSPAPVTAAAPGPPGPPDSGSVLSSTVLSENAPATAGSPASTAPGSETSATAGARGTDGSNAAQNGPGNGDQDDLDDDIVAEPRDRLSNLEQVTDWVTKLLLGGGLTQMQRIPPKIWQWSRVVAYGILGENSPRMDAALVPEQAFACGLMVYGFLLGFFSGFLITKIQLGKTLSQ